MVLFGATIIYSVVINLVTSQNAVQKWFAQNQVWVLLATGLFTLMCFGVTWLNSAWSTDYPANPSDNREDSLTDAKDKSRATGVESGSTSPPDSTFGGQQSLEPKAKELPRVKVAPFDEKFISTFPFPIAQACANFNQEQEVPGPEATRLFIAMDVLFVAILKYLAGVFVAQARFDLPPEFPLPKRLDWIVAPGLNDWAETLYELAQIYQEAPWRDKWLLGELHLSCTRPLARQGDTGRGVWALAHQLNESAPEASVVEFLKLWARVRGAQWGEAPGLYSVERIQKMLPVLQPALAAVLSELEPLSGYPLVYTERVDRARGKHSLRLIKFMGLKNEIVPTLTDAPLTLPEAEGHNIKRRRLYIADEKGVPQLSLHPFIVVCGWELYLLDRHGRDSIAEFRSCSSQTRFVPPPESQSYCASWWQKRQEAPSPIVVPTTPKVDDDVPPVLGVEENGALDSWEEGVSLLSPSEVTGLPPRTWLSAEAQEVLEMALGEALRMGYGWLGIEFLLMALSRQEGRPFTSLLQQIGVAPRQFRGMMRTDIVVQSDDWQSFDVRIVGATEFPRLRVATPELLRDIMETEREEGGNSESDTSPWSSSFLVMTPRVEEIIRQARVLAKGAQIRHIHLIRAALRHPQAMGMVAFVGIAQRAGCSQQRLKALARMVEQQEV